MGEGMRLYPGTGAARGPARVAGCGTASGGAISPSTSTSPTNTTTRCDGRSSQISTSGRWGDERDGAPRGLTLRGVARLSGVSVAYLSEIERDKGNLSLDLLERLARVYDVDPLALLGGDSSQYARRLVAEARLARIAA